jgi:hypothetical protein
MLRSWFTLMVTTAHVLHGHLQLISRLHSLGIKKGHMLDGQGTQGPIVQDVGVKVDPYFPLKFPVPSLAASVFCNGRNNALISINRRN